LLSRRHPRRARHRVGKRRVVPLGGPGFEDLDSVVVDIVLRRRQRRQRQKNKLLMR